MGYRLLLIENESHTRELRRVSQEKGECDEIVPCFTIRSAIDFINTKDHVDVIVSAAHLENESAFDFLKAVKNSEHLRNVPFIMFCADPGTLAMTLNDTMEKTAYVLGADRYITMQNFDANKVMEEIDEVKPVEPAKELDKDNQQL